MYTSNLKL